ncbi:MAG: hypothetical protein D6732_09820 [Methanobacteriota archaeon]|nr:MAG: hypothetical protein D6732_09820 [Euryarchaeota archaeon]
MSINVAGFSFYFAICKQHGKFLIAEKKIDDLQMEVPYDKKLPDEDIQFHCQNRSCSFDFSPAILGLSKRILALSEGSASLENGIFRCPVCNTLYVAKSVTLMDEKQRPLSSLFLEDPKPLKWGVNVAAS